MFMFINMYTNILDVSHSLYMNINMKTDTDKYIHGHGHELGQGHGHGHRHDMNMKIYRYIALKLDFDKNNRFRVQGLDDSLLYRFKMYGSETTFRFIALQ